eukprot:COSAG06_NODE_2366_length_7002_cov_11.463277_9_plen_94_part_00
MDSGRLEQALNSKHTKHKVSELIVEKEMQLLQAQPSKSSMLTLTLTLSIAQLWTTCCWLLAAGCWLLAAGCWLLALAGKLHCPGCSGLIVSMV